MPLIRIDVIEGHADADLAAISAAVHRGIVGCFGVPERDRFQTITEHRPGRLVYKHVVSQHRARVVRRRHCG